MTEIEPAEQIVPKIMDKYNESPRGWRILSTPTGGMIFLGPKSAFQLKLISLGPQKFTGAGMQLSERDDSLDRLASSPEFGLRPLMKSDIEGLADAVGDAEKAKQSIRTLLERAPLSPAEAKKNRAEQFLSGPVLTRPELSSLGPAIKKAELTLDKNAQDIFRKKYPMRAGMYM